MIAQIPPLSSSFCMHLVEKILEGGEHARSARWKVVSSWGDYEGCETYFDDVEARGAREILP